MLDVVGDGRLELLIATDGGWEIRRVGGALGRASAHRHADERSSAYQSGMDDASRPGTDTIFHPIFVHLFPHPSGASRLDDGYEIQRTEASYRRC